MLCDLFCELSRWFTGTFWHTPILIELPLYFRMKLKMINNSSRSLLPTKLECVKAKKSKLVKKNWRWSFRKFEWIGLMSMFSVDWYVWTENGNRRYNCQRNTIFKFIVLRRLRKSNQIRAMSTIQINDRVPRQFKLSRVNRRAYTPIKWQNELNECIWPY